MNEYYLTLQYSMCLCAYVWVCVCMCACLQECVSVCTWMTVCVWLLLLDGFFVSSEIFLTKLSNLPACMKALFQWGGGLLICQTVAKCEGYYCSESLHTVLDTVCTNLKLQNMFAIFGVYTFQVSLPFREIICLNFHRAYSLDMGLCSIRPSTRKDLFCAKHISPRLLLPPLALFVPLNSFSSTFMSYIRA